MLFRSQFGDIPSYQCSGTPVDCVKIAIDKILHRKPDLCVSGINHGSNAAINVIYSGTMSAAMEAAIDGIPAVGFSLLDFSFEVFLVNIISISFEANSVTQVPSIWFCVLDGPI